MHMISFLLVAVAHKGSMVLGGIFKSSGLRIADNNVAAGLDQFSDTAAVKGRVVLAKRLFTVDKNGFTASSGDPSIGTAATRMDAAVSCSNGRSAIDGDIG